MGGMIQLWDGKNTERFAVMSRDQVRSFDRWAIEQVHIPGAVLMENAGRNAAACLAEQIGSVQSAQVAIFCGPGNNGGDGFVITRHLANRGARPTVILCADRQRIRGEALTHLQIIEAMNLPIQVLDWEGNLLEQVRQMTAEANWIADALLGTGLQGQVHEPMAELICALNAAGKPICAVDIPSGLDCDRGIPLPICIQAEMTVTFAALKKGFVQTPQSRQVTGRIYVASIGISPGFLPGA